MPYIDEFINHDCAGDIMNIIPKQKKYHKEITESMGVISRLRKDAMQNKMELTLVDMCAGNALTSVLSVFILPIKKAYAIDKKKRDGRYNLAKRFEYIEGDIFKPETWIDKLKFDGKQNHMLIGVHACGQLANEIIRIYNSYPDEFRKLYLMPCCPGNMAGSDNFLIEKLGKYTAWCYQLKEMIKTKCKIYRDKKIISPANIIIEARR